MIRFYQKSFVWCVLLMLCTFVTAHAQIIDVAGTIVDNKGVPIIGATVLVKGTTNGVVTNLDGEFMLKANKKDVLQISSIGYNPMELALEKAQLPLKITLEEAVAQLQDVVVIGYGSVKKKDLTGSITTINDKDFQKGMIATPDQLIAGKIAGVQITQNGGAPGAGSRIRIRGGASLNASNDPLIIIDGVPVDNNGIAGAPSVLSTINPSDILSMNVLKDASATAIYGSRASNGVIIITTKSGRMGQPMNIAFSTQFTTSTPIRYLNVLSAPELTNLVKEKDLTAGKDYLNKLGQANTDWQKQIYQNAMGTDNNLSITGAAKWLPYRVSLGFFRQDGILKTDNMQRMSAGISLNPKLLNGDLQLAINLKGSQIKNRFADRGAIINAISMDPTQPIKSDAPTYDNFNHYFTWLSGNVPNNLAPFNPVAMIDSRNDRTTVYNSVGSVKADYRLPFMKELKLTLNLGYDYSASTGSLYIPTWAPHTYSNQEPGKGGIDNHFKQEKLNKLLDFYGEYDKAVESLHSKFNLMAGYSYQDWKTYVHNFPQKTAGGIEYAIPNFPFDYPQNTLVSFYSRLNYTYMDKYLFTATMRTDGSSRFAKSNRWGIFPSMALAWKIKEEAFLKDVKAVSDLKLRLGYGITGQQDGIANYSYLAVYYLSGDQSMYQLGNQFFNMYKPSAYDASIKWEQTATTNVGLDFGFFDNRIYGSVDYYHKNTKDLLNVISIPAGSNFSNTILTNVGNIENNGLELSLGMDVLNQDDWKWSVNANVTFNKTKITKLNLTEDPTSLGVPTGGIAGLTGANIQIHSVGYAPSTFFVYKQVYDEKGKPIEGLYEDLNKDGVINDADKYHFKSPEPKVFAGLSTTLSYKNMSLSTSLRANLGNYVYDNVSARLSNYSSMLNPSGFVSNVPANINDYGFKFAQYYSDLYVKPASFLKMDNLSFNYDFGKILNNSASLSMGATIQNVFTLSSYKGLDPEIAGGIDYNLYPMPRIYSLKLNLTF